MAVDRHGDACARRGRSTAIATSAPREPATAAPRRSGHGSILAVLIVLYLAVMLTIYFVEPGLR